jgi:cytochrome subunit of sulfide dehydrogenase
LARPRKPAFSAPVTLCSGDTTMRPKALPGAILSLFLLALPGLAAAQAPLAAEGCIGCHGPDGRGVTGGASINGRDRAEMIAILTAFRANERPGTIMGRIARGYTEAEIAAVAEYFSRIR